MTSPGTPNGEIARQACIWVEKKARGGSMKGFDAWANRSPEHLRAYLQIAAIVKLLPHSRVLREMDVEAVLRATRPDLRGRFGQFIEKISQHLVTVSALAAMLIMGAIVMGLLGGGQHKLADSEKPEKAEMQDKAGQWTPFSAAQAAREVPLSDGSRLRMESGSRLRVRITDAERVVQLEDGDVLFEVRSDSTRPFFVDVERARITALGTIFQVQRFGDDTRVSVQEGSVQVMSRADATPLVARRGEAVLIRPEGSEIEGPTTALPARKTSSAAGDTVTRTLSEIAASFNAANATPQFVVEGAARDERLWVDVATTEPEKLIAVLESEPGIEVSREDGRVVIRLK